MRTRRPQARTTQARTTQARTTQARTVQAAAAALVALAAGVLGTVPALAATEIPLPAPGACQEGLRFPKHDLRAMWIATVLNVDWPARPGQSAADQQQQMRDWLDLAVRNNFNAVVLQVRPSADAFWPSAYEPWSAYLTGVQGRDPGYDPLAFAVEQAHQRNLAVHAWFNPYRVTMGPRMSKLAPGHPARQHPEWLVRHQGRITFDPGIPQVREHVVNAIMDAVTRYDIDAVHFDDYFYPYGARGKRFADAATYAAYGGGLSLADWRRANVNALIKDVSDRIRASKPWVQFGISPFAVWRNAATDPSGSRTRAGVESYDDLYADTRMWVREGWIDYIAPQAYWTRGFRLADYEKVVQWWAGEVDASRANGHDVGLYIGEATYKAGTNDGRWRRPRELSQHLAYAAGLPQVQGHIYFSAKDVRADRKRSTTRLVRRWYSRPALQPVVGAASGSATGSASGSTSDTAPSPVTDATARAGALAWTGSDDQATGYAIYRVPRAEPASCDLADARYLAATLRRTGASMSWTDPSPRPDATYVITAVNRQGRESAGVIASAG
ncbi:MAG: family 10 glycosylhydrolase [Actinomycetales bacterium]|nr:family 10 glycosylhydrolase [Actinomycetales bacterium]